MAAAPSPFAGAFQELQHAYRTHIREAGNELPMIATLSFLCAFLVVRLITHAIRNHIGPFQNIEGAGLHIHHVVPGLVLLLLAGVLALTQEARRLGAVLFGVGAALVLDEFALVLNLADVYWEPQGRESIDAILIFGSVLLVVAFGGGFWRAAWQVLRRARLAV